MKNLLKRKIAKFSDELLLESLNHNATKEELNDWKNWGNNELKLMAQEASKRGLI